MTVDTCDNSRAIQCYVLLRHWFEHGQLASLVLALLFSQECSVCCLLCSLCDFGQPASFRHDLMFASVFLQPFGMFLNGSFSKQYMFAGLWFPPACLIGSSLVHYPLKSASHFELIHSILLTSVGDYTHTDPDIDCWLGFPATCSLCQAVHCIRGLFMYLVWLLTFAS